MRWMLNLDGGPKRVNHAAVAIGDKIYSFGGYTATEIGNQNEFIDIHVLNTFTYRWERLPVDFDGKKSRRSATISGPGPSEPSTSQSLQVNNRRRARSLSNTHPLAHIRSQNPPLDEELPLPPIHSPTRAVPADEPVEMNEQDNEEEENMIIMSVQMDETMESEEERRQQNALIREIFDGIPERLFEDDNFSEHNSSETEEMASANGNEIIEFVEADDTTDFDDDDDDYEDLDDDQEDSDDEPRMLIQMEGLGELEIPVNMDIQEIRKFQLHPEIPFKRYGHTVVNYQGQAYLWGGRNDLFGCRTDLHRYDPVANRWSIVPAQGQCPPARDGHTAVVFGDSMIIFGGYEEKELRFSQETYAFHFPSGTWTRKKTQGEPPQYRDFHTACVQDGKMYVFGGRSDEQGQSHSGGDIYDPALRFLDLRTLCWHQVEVKDGEQRPCGRRSHTMWSSDGYIYLFGGYQSVVNVHFNDLWRFDPIASKWTLLKTSGQAPSPRRRQCTVMVGSRLFLFGGTMPNPKKKSALEDLGDLFVLDFSPSLASLCMQTINSYSPLRRQAESVLPEMLSRELYYMNTPNQLSKPTVRIGNNARG